MTCYWTGWGNDFVEVVLLQACQNIVVLQHFFQFFLKGNNRLEFVVKRQGDGSADCPEEEADTSDPVEPCGEQLNKCNNIGGIK